jgi:ribosomal protein S18 acetylase RimI-like enzyme
MGGEMARPDGILPGYRGHIDAVEPAVSGWVAEIARPAAPVVFFLRIDRGDTIAVVADRPRTDVASAGLAGANCGFSVDLPARLLDGAEHDLDLLLPDGRSLNLPGRPQRVALGPVRTALIPASAASLDAVVGLLRQTDFEAGFDPDLIGLEHAAAFNALGSSDRGFLFYARTGNRLVGYGRLDRHHSDAGVLGVVALTVLEAYRRKGIGEALLRALLRSAAEASGLREVWLSVRPDNMPALGLYDKCDFVRKASHPAGQWAARGEITMVWMPRDRMPRQARPG